MWLLIIRVLCICWTCWTQELRMDVSIGQGHLRGRNMRTKSGREFYGFMGIPYATPPVGSLRFMPPVRHPGWGGVLDVSNFRSPCPQFDERGLLVGDENCLFLNVFTPAVPRGRVPGSDVTFPVMVFIHGGFYESGSSNVYGPEKILDKGIVLVTLNYRLGTLGFFSTGDDSSPGNWGLLDQQTALQWVRENVASFGGDPGQITLFGEGAGAAAVTMHMVSPLSQGLFSRAIAQSGSALCEWAVEKNPLEFAMEVGRRARCPTDTTGEMVYCLRKAPVADILRAQQELKLFGPFPVRTAPVVERTGSNRFLPEDPFYLMERENVRRVPFMAGVNRDEGAFLYPVLTTLFRDSIRDVPNFLRDTLLPRFLQHVMNLKGNTEGAVRALLFEYFSGTNPMNLTDIVRPFANMSGDALFFVCTDITLKTYSRFNSPTFMYTFEYRGANTLVDYESSTIKPNIDTGVSHGDELLYLFQLNLQGLRPASLLDDIVSSRMLTLWTDFARYGEAPQFVNFEYPRWHPFTSESLSYYTIDRELKSQRSYRQRFVDLWLRHIPALVDPNTPTPEALTDTKMVAPVYRTLSWAMVAVCIALLVLVIVLLAILYNQKRSQSFRANSQDESGRSTSTLY